MAGIRTMGTVLTLKKAGQEADDTVLAHLANIGEKTTEAEEIDVTTLDSPGGNKEFIQGPKDPGTVDVVANNMFDGEVVLLKAIFDSGVVRSWEETMISGATLGYDGYISSFTFGEETTDGLYTASFSIRRTGEEDYEETA
jgi:hypothetical protein